MKKLNTLNLTPLQLRSVKALLWDISQTRRGLVLSAVNARKNYGETIWHIVKPALIGAGIITCNGNHYQLAGVDQAPETTTEIIPEVIKPTPEVIPETTTEEDAQTAKELMQLTKSVDCGW